MHLISKRIINETYEARGQHLTIFKVRRPNASGCVSLLTLTHIDPDAFDCDAGL